MDNAAAATPRRDIYVNLHFDLKRDGRKYTAICLFCDKTLSNVATQRLKAHRRKCLSKRRIQEQITNIIVKCECKENTKPNAQAYFEAIENASGTVVEMGTEAMALVFNDDLEMDVIEFDSKSDIEKQIISTGTSRATSETILPASSLAFKSNSTSSETHRSFKVPRSRKLNTSSGTGLKNYMDTISKKEEAEVNELVGKFFYGCNIPLSVIDSGPFKNLINKLNPAYGKIMPGRKQLSTTLLDKEYERQIQRGKTLIGTESVLLIDGWKNKESKTVVAVLRNSTGEKVFLNAWDLSGEPETADRLSQIINESIDLALKLYNTEVYSVVSNNAASLMKMGRSVSIWHNNCSAHTANLLAKSVLDKKLTENVTSILKEFIHVDLESIILFKGGTKIQMPCVTRWCSHRDSFVCLKDNISFMRQIAADPVKKIKRNVKQLLFDDDFIEEVERNIKLLDPICALINKAQESNCSLADIANIWLTLTPPQGFENFKDKFAARTSQALNVYALCAFFVHPYYDKQKLNSEQKNVIIEFFMNVLDGQGLHEWDLYINQQEYFRLLLSKNLDDAFLFWRMASLKYPSFSKLALRLITIPASSVQIERTFSNWSYVHSGVRNRLTFERSKKLIHVYHNLKMSDENSSDEY